MIYVFKILMHNYINMKRMNDVVSPVEIFETWFSVVFTLKYIWHWIECYELWLHIIRKVARDQERKAVMKCNPNEVNDTYAFKAILNRDI